ncbi:MAG TPA: FtsQ-type POTRA domain-containing protein [Bryobacteraceae bacterium]
MARRQQQQLGLFQPFAEVHWVRFSIWVGAGIVLLFLVLLAWRHTEEFLINDPRFILSEPDDFANASTSLTIEGVHYASKTRIREVFAQDLGRSLYLAPIHKRRKELLDLAWVKDATVSKVWPDTLRVTIHERVPVAFVHLPPRKNGSSEFALIDKDGYILRPRVPAKFTLPVIEGISQSQPIENRRACVGRVMEMLQEIGPLAGRISEINVSDPDNLVVEEHMGNRVLSLELGDENYRERLKNFLANYSAIEARRPEATIYDLRVDGVITTRGGRNDGR